MLNCIALFLFALFPVPAPAPVEPDCENLEGPCYETSFAITADQEDRGRAVNIPCTSVVLLRKLSTCCSIGVDIAVTFANYSSTSDAEVEVYEAEGTFGINGLSSFSGVSLVGSLPLPSSSGYLTTEESIILEGVLADTCCSDRVIVFRARRRDQFGDWTPWEWSRADPGGFYDRYGYLARRECGKTLCQYPDLAPVEEDDPFGVEDDWAFRTLEPVNESNAADLLGS